MGSSLSSGQRDNKKWVCYAIRDTNLYRGSKAWNNFFNLQMIRFDLIQAYNNVGPNGLKFFKILAKVNLRTARLYAGTNNRSLLAIIG